MNSIERTTLTLQHKLPDRVPVDLPNFMVTARRMGASDFADFFRTAKPWQKGRSNRRASVDVIN
jgi:hypothetical protein